MSRVFFRAFAALVACAPIAIACQPAGVTAAAPTQTPAPVAEETPRLDSCHRDIPDCSAACSLRETNHLEFIDFYDRRCAAVILGRNPDKVVPVPTAPPPPTAPEVTVRNPDDISTNPYR